MRVLPGAVPCGSGCGRDVVVLPERGGRRVPFDAALMAAADDHAGLGFMLVRRRGERLGALVPVAELPDGLAAAGAWRLMRHMCVQRAGREDEVSLVGDLSHEG